MEVHPASAPDYIVEGQEWDAVDEPQSYPEPPLSEIYLAWRQAKALEGLPPSRHRSHSVPSHSQINLEPSTATPGPLMSQELFVLILRFLIQPSSSNSSLEDLVSVSLVSTPWQKICYAETSLWTQLAIRAPRPFLMQYGRHLIANIPPVRNLTIVLLERETRHLKAFEYTYTSVAKWRPFMSFTGR
ncbi:hypothetical protein NMY22_g19023 [Coprinellus aureogranulatus]|nr:hypothetical protein NMY22_g19023 [Coprinellus aureogranulatus]